MPQLGSDLSLALVIFMNKLHHQETQEIYLIRGMGKWLEKNKLPIVHIYGLVDSIGKT